MISKKIFARLFVFFVGVPLVLFIVNLPYFNHLALHIAICIVSCIAASEMYDMFAVKVKMYSKSFVIICSAFIPVCITLYEVIPAFVNVNFLVGTEIILYALIISFVAILFVEVITAKTFKNSNARVSASVFTVIYSGCLLTFLSRMTMFVSTDSEPKDISTPLIIIFLLMVFLCDSFAWFFGILFGKNNRGLIKASPNKSIAGFLGGFLGSICVGLVGAYLFPTIFFGSIIKIIFLSICIAFSSIVGDLAESVLKRSAELKDSGHIIPGRGGILDSIDSVLISAPVFYFLFSILYSPLP